MNRAYMWAGMLLLVSSGCHAIPHGFMGMDKDSAGPANPALYTEMPRELSKVVLPTYRIEPPDILLVEAINLVPRAPYRLRSSDVLNVQARGTLPDAPLNAPFVIGPGGLLNLGLPYGSVKVTGLTLDEASMAVQEHLKTVLQEPYVSLSLMQMAGMQQIAGDHLVKQDGTITLGAYGSVPVVGMTLDEAKRAIEAHLSQFLEQPEVSVDVFAFNSKVYYVVTEGAGLGDGVTKFPVTGNETVLDAISNINGLTQVSSKTIWIARPTPFSAEVQILPVDWVAITAQGNTATNYQVMPGDRIFVAEDKLVAFDTNLGKLLTPFERIFGFSTLGVNTISRFSGKVIFNRNQTPGFGNF
jgi:polysaccharide biosynthesis/export protein